MKNPLVIDQPPLRRAPPRRKSPSTQRKCVKGAWVPCTLGYGHEGECAYEPFRGRRP
jgi:hypothetical protein